VRARASKRGVPASALISIANKSEQFQKSAAEKLVSNTVADFISLSIRVVYSVSSIPPKLRLPTRDCNGNARILFLYIYKEDFRNENSNLTSLSRDCPRAKFIFRSPHDGFLRQKGISISMIARLEKV